MLLFFFRCFLFFFKFLAFFGAQQKGESPSPRRARERLDPRVPRFAANFAVWKSICVEVWSQDGGYSRCIKACLRCLDLENGNLGEVVKRCFQVGFRHSAFGRHLRYRWEVCFIKIDDFARVAVHFYLRIKS